MRLTIIALIVVGLLAALSAAVLAATLRADARRKSTPKEDAPTVEVLVASRDMPAMYVIESASITTATVLQSEVPPGALTNTVQVIGQVLAIPVLEGQVFTRRSLISDEHAVHLAAAIPEGGRAMTLQLDSDSSVSGILYPGCLVDVVASFKLPSRPGQSAGEILSATLLQGVRVLAVGGRSIVTNEMESDDPMPNIVEGRRGQLVTLLVDQEQSEALQLAKRHGDITLVLRNPLDTDLVSGEGVMLSKLSEELAQRLTALAQDEVESAPLVPGAQETIAPTAPLRGGRVSPMTQRTQQPESPGQPDQPRVTAPELQYWTTVILRGSAVETLNFPLDEETPQEPAQEASETPADAPAGA